LKQYNFETWGFEIYYHYQKHISNHNGKSFNSIFLVRFTNFKKSLRLKRKCKYGLNQTTWHLTYLSIPEIIKEYNFHHKLNLNHWKKKLKDPFRPMLMWRQWRGNESEQTCFQGLAKNTTNRVFSDFQIENVNLILH
jgi:hypothetical protein